MIDVLACIYLEHNLFLVACAAGICVAGAWISLRLFARARDSDGWTRAGWLFLNGVAAGSAIWCTHFVSMLAYETPAPVFFDPVPTILSLFIAIVGTAIGFGVASSGRFPLAPEAGGMVIGAATTAMHYLGMRGYRVEGLVSWDETRVVWSVVLALALGGLALNRAMRPVTIWCRYGALAVFVAMIVSLHFTGMSALRIEVLGPSVPQDADALWALALSVMGVGTMVVGMGVVTALLDHRTRAVADADRLRLSTRDPLTGLGNRTTFLQVLSEACAWSDTGGGRVFLALVDLDDFKTLNDLRGQSAGDAYLAALGARIRDDMGVGECAIRLGGDEFAIVARVPATQDLQSFLTRMRDLVCAPVRASGTLLGCSASLGGGAYPDHGLSAQDLHANTALALSRAKANSLGDIEICDTSIDDRERRRRALSVDLRTVVDRDELHLVFQPQLDLETGRCNGAEALLRWRHPDFGPVSPADFIPLAEDNGAILQIGDWVLCEACRAAATWTRPLHLGVNLSAVQLMRGDLPERVAAILADTGLPAERLELEVTETALMASPEKNIAVLAALRALGVSVTLDDFGTGYSALASLRSFPFDRLKLDRGFINDLVSCESARAIVHSVIMLGQSLKVPVVAEGVETPDQLAFLQGAGCSTVQGFLYARPMAPADLMRFVEAEKHGASSLGPGRVAEVPSSGFRAVTT